MKVKIADAVILLVQFRFPRKATLYHWDAEEVSISFLSECLCLNKFIKIGMGLQLVVFKGLFI